MEGTHKFRAYIYPEVSGGESLVDSITPNTTVNLSELPLLCPQREREVEGEREREGGGETGGQSDRQ